MAAGQGPVTHRWLHRAISLANQHLRAEYLALRFRVETLSPLSRRNRLIALVDAFDRDIDAALARESAS